MKSQGIWRSREEKDCGLRNLPFMKEVILCGKMNLETKPNVFYIHTRIC